MDTRQASEHLQVIRTLMERSALYRRALAPVMTAVGTLGLVGAGVGRMMEIYRPAGFVVYWYFVAVVALTTALVLVRRQAIKDGEGIWSLPTRRVSGAMLPALAAGCIIGFLFMLGDWGHGRFNSAASAPPSWSVMIGLPCIWAVLSGCALHAAGFFTQRGLRLFGWILIAAGCAGLVLASPREAAHLVDWSYGLMGSIFGGLHLAYGIYLYFTESRKTA